MFAEWTNASTVQMAGRVMLAGLALIAITSVGTWLIGRWSGDD